MNRGFVIAGNMIMDVIKLISAFPKRHELVNILEKQYSLGGLVNNVIRDLARLDPDLPLRALSLIGEDQEGDMILDALGKYPNIDLSLVQRRGQSATTDVLAEADTKVRSFLTFFGANGALDIEHFPIDQLDCDIFHLGYILLLPMLDRPDPEYGTRMARLLCAVQSRGILTSVDVVSEVGDRYQTLVPPALRYTDYFITNELEAGKTCGIELRDESGALMIERIPEVLIKLKEMGVRRWAVIHTPEGGFGLDESGRYVAVPSLALPEGYIAGTVGAGDAFCAGALYAAYSGSDIESALQLGAATAAMSLSEPGASEGVGTAAKARALYERTPKQSLGDVAIK